MGKIITLPSWISPASIKSDANIPAQADISISGQDLDCTNIKLSSVRTVLGESTYDLYSLCRSSLINIWSKFRPGGWKANGVSGSVWLPSGNSQPNFVADYPAESKLGDFALYCHTLGRKPTYYDTLFASTVIIEAGDTLILSTRLKRGYKIPVCEEQGALAAAWEKVATQWKISDTETGTETWINDDPASGGETVPEIGASPDYLEHSTDGLSSYISLGQTKWIHCRPYYISGSHIANAVSMIEDGQQTFQLQYVDLRCTGVINSYTHPGTHVSNKTIACNWTVTRNTGAPARNIEVKIVVRSAYKLDWYGTAPTERSEFTQGSTKTGFYLTDGTTEGSASDWPNTILEPTSLNSGDTRTETTNVNFSTPVSSSPEANNNVVQLYARIQGGGADWKLLDTMVITWD